MTGAGGTQFHYPLRALVFDYAGGGTGFALAAGLVVFARPAPPVAAVLAAVAALFLVYFGRTACRQLTRIELDDAGIRAVGPLGGAIRWDQLCSLRLDYYSTRADREGGWMQLRLRDARRTIRIDSGLEGFETLAREAARRAAHRGLAFDAATAANLEALR